MRPQPIRSLYDSQEKWEAAMDSWLEEKNKEAERETIEFDEEDRYDRFGNVQVGGMYDAGGHLVDVEALYDYIDHLGDRDR